MSKKITLPERFTREATENRPARTFRNPWQGSVTLCEPLTLSQVEMIEAAQGIEYPGRYYLTAFDKDKIPVILKCVEEWNLIEFPKEPTLENIPMTPRVASHLFVDWLWDEVIKVYEGEQEIPNE
jgi:hypothetical protein